MPEKRTIQRARKDKREGKAPTTQAGEFVREEIDHIRQGIHGVANVKQAIAIGLSKARKAGIPIPDRSKSSSRRSVSSAPRRKRESAQKRSRVTLRVLKRKPRSGATTRALSLQVRGAAKKRGAQARSASARKAVRTKGPIGRRQAALKAARTRRR